MDKQNRLTENDIRLLSKQELSRVEGGAGQPDPELKCIYCGMCFRTKTELKIHMKNCPKRNDP